MNRNNKTIISIVTVVIAVVICFFGYNFYQKKQAEVVSAEKLTSIHETIKKFNDGNDRNKRLNLLKDTLDEQSKYNLNSYKDSKVQDKYKNNKAKKENSSKNSDEKSGKANTTHYENEYFSVDVPKKWDKIWSLSMDVDSSNLGTPSQPAIIYSFKHDPEGNVPFGGAQTIYVFPDGVPNKANSSPILKKLNSKVYLGAGAASGFFSTDGNPDRATIKVK